jgi:hypothetical protein
MSKLKLSEWANLAEIGASLVVVASLAYVGLEINQNTKAVHAATFQGFVGNLTQVDLAVVTNPNLDRIIRTGELSPDDLSKQDWSTFSRYSLARTGQFELAYLSYLDGTMNDSQWSGIRPFIHSLFCLPGYRRFWNENSQSTFAPVFIDYVESNVLPLCSS